MVKLKGSYENGIKKGEKHGPWEHFHSNGLLHSKGSFEHGIKKGLWIE